MWCGVDVGVGVGVGCHAFAAPDERIEPWCSTAKACSPSPLQHAFEVNQALRRACARASKAWHHGTPWHPVLLHPHDQYHGETFDGGETSESHPRGRTG